METLITVGVVGLLAAIGTLTIGGVVGKASSQKLSADVDSLNRSVSAFLSSGGDLSGMKSADEVLSALKLNLTNASRIPGFSGSKIDERLSFEYQSSAEAQGSNWRVYWDEALTRFVLAQSGDQPGIKAFAYNAEPEVETPNVPKRELRKAKTPMLYAESSNWIWDYEDAAASAAPGPTSITLSEVANTTPAPPAPPAGGGPSGSSFTPLTPPQFSIAGGAFPVTSFNLPLALLNPNPAGSSDLYYSVNFGNWNLYTGPISVAPGAVVAAQAVPASGQYTSSARVDQTYTALPTGLIPPVITPSAPEFGLFTNRDLTITITIADQNSPSISRIEYRIGGDPWQPYASPFTLSRNAYPSGTLVQARAVPVNPLYLASSATLRTLGVELAKINGAAAGSFSNPSGQVDMITNLAAGASSDYFAWGRDYLNYGESVADGVVLAKSWLDYDGMTFNTVPLGERFALGSLSYFNGTILEGSSADAVSFAVNLNLGISGLSANTTFNFDFELVNVINNNDPNNLWADADFVRLASPVASQNVTVGGIEFQLKLEFGETTTNGFASFNEFHVLEHKSATTRLYGTRVEVGSLNFNK